METIIEQYRTWLIANSQKPNTIRAYIHHITLFFKLTNLQSVAEITDEVIVNYFAELKKTNPAQATYNHHISALKNFLEYQNILVRIPKSKKPPKKIIDILTEDDFKNVMLPIVEREFDNAIKIKTFLYFLYCTGMRVEDATKVKRNQFNLAKNYVRIIIGKQNLEKEILIPNELKEILIKYFVSEAEEASAFNLDVNQVAGIFANLRWMLPDLKLHAHKFRKSFATNAYKMGMRLEEIQELFGHSSIQTTQIYVQPPTAEEIREKYLKLEAEKKKKEDERLKRLEANKKRKDDTNGNQPHE